MTETNTVIPYSLLTDYDVALFRSGKHIRIYEKLGAQLITVKKKKGVQFGVWAPNGASVSVIGDFNGWNKSSHQLNIRQDGSGIWEGFIPELKKGTVYKYFIINAQTGKGLEKGDPYGFYWEKPPQTASVVWDNDYKWSDKKWMKKRKDHNGLDKPMSVYEMHYASWRKNLEANGEPLTYREMAEVLPDYLADLNFTHVEFLPLMEHPYDGSWGYQLVGYFASSSRFGTPQDFMYLVEALHKKDIGVIMDWVPSHFPYDSHGLGYFDGTHLYEHSDPRQGFHPDWKTFIYNYSRNEVRSFLMSSAIYWLDRFHIDALRVDAVASMLYLDYSRDEGQWIPNKHGGNENLEAVSFLQETNQAVYREFPDVQMIAEESTSWTGVSRPVYTGGLGFGMKWMMGWMHDTLNYFKKDPVYRKFHQNDITFSMIYAFSENFMLPLSHDEVVHGKGSLLSRMPGDEWQRFANLRTMFAYMFTHPGTKLLFMGAEIAQKKEWNHKTSLDWHLLGDEKHKGIYMLIKDLNALYKSEKALYEKQFSHEGFEWIDTADNQNCILLYKRKSEDESLIMAVNFTPVPQKFYRVGISEKGTYRELFNSDHERYGGSNVLNTIPIATEELPFHGRDHSLEMTIPPLGLVVLKREKNDNQYIKQANLLSK